MSDHSRFGGSIADRWLNCPGSVALCASVPKLPDSSYAAEGTLAHEYAADALKSDLREMSYYKDHDLPEDMSSGRSVYLDTVYAEMAKAKDAELYVETTFAFAGAGDGKEVYGTNDAIVYSPSIGRLVVFDYKHGVGVSVSADNNAQLKFYAAGAYLANPRWKVREVELVIVQPRARDVDEAGAVKRWPMATIDLINFADEVRAGVIVAKSPSAALQTGSWCRWCDAAAICPAREAEALKALTLAYSTVKVEPVQLPTPQNLANDKIDGAARIGEIIKGIEVLTTWANQVREFAEAHMLAGTLAIPGWKVVDKIGRRKWTAADREVINYAALVFDLGPDDIAPRKLVTLTDAEKQLKALGVTKAEIEAFMLKFTVKESSGLTIAPEGDRREAVNAAERAYSDVKI
jgi:hypothetical protein